MTLQHCCNSLFWCWRAWCFDIPSSFLGIHSHTDSICGSSLTLPWVSLRILHSAFLVLSFLFTLQLTSFFRWTFWSKYVLSWYYYVIHSNLISVLLKLHWVSFQNSCYLNWSDGGYHHLEFWMRLSYGFEFCLAFVEKLD